MALEQALSDPIKVVVFDRFFRDETGNYSPYGDTAIEEVEFDPRFEITEYTNKLGEAAELLLAMSKHEAPRPNVIITGGTLEGERGYIEHPPIATFDEERRVKRFGLGREVTRPVERHRYLLPVMDNNRGDIVLPEAPGEKVAHLMPHIGDGFKRGRDSFGASSVASAYVLTHLARILLPDAKIVGHSAHYPGTVPFDDFVPRGQPREYTPLEQAEGHTGRHTLSKAIERVARSTSQ